MAGQPHACVFLDVLAPEPRVRIEPRILVADDPDEDARVFRHSNIDRSIAAREDMPPDALVMRADQHSARELADLVIASSGLSVSAGHT